MRFIIGHRWLLVTFFLICLQWVSVLLKTVSCWVWDEASVCLDPYLRQGNMIQDSGILVSEPTTVEALLLLDLPGTEQCSLNMVISWQRNEMGSVVSQEPVVWRHSRPLPDQKGISQNPSRTKHTSRNDLFVRSYLLDFMYYVTRILELVIKYR